MRHFRAFEKGLEFCRGGETVWVMPWGVDSFRVVATPMGELKTDSIALLEQPDLPFEIDLDDDIARITNGKITAEVDTRGWNSSAIIRFYNADGELLLAETEGGGALLKRARFFKPIIGGDHKLKMTFEANPDEKIYGMGQYQQDDMDLKGMTLELAHRNSQVSVPYYISNKGYGFLWHNAAIGDVFFGKNKTVWTAESTKQLDYWITAADKPDQLVKSLAEVTGKPPMMPEYGLGFWQCKLRYYNQEQALEVAREYHKRKIPVDVFIIDYYHWPRCGDYRFDEDFYPDPGAMIKSIKDMGMEPMVSVWPQIDVRSENFQEMFEKNLLVKTEHGLNVQMFFHGNNIFYDATNPKARAYVWEKCRQNYGQHGIRIFWLDEAEPEFSTYDFDNYRYHIGPVVQTGNVYPREYAKGFYEGQQKNGQTDAMNLVRCAWVGSQRYGALIWSGDIHSTYQDFKNQICAGLQMGLAGIPWWTTDIGGFHGGHIEDENFKELLIRWFQFGTFCPVMRLHGSRLPRTKLYKKTGEETEGTGAANEIWSYGEKPYEIMKHYIDIREAMRDYSRSLMKEAHEKGSPVMRTLFYEFPDDTDCWDITTAYMYGPDLLIAPIVEQGALTRSVYLPKGANWTHTLDGKVYEGGQTVCVDAPIESIPVFLRDNQQAFLLDLWQ